MANVLMNQKSVNKRRKNEFQKVKVYGRNREGKIIW
jgi:hypothetical protein